MLVNSYSIAAQENTRAPYGTSQIPYSAHSNLNEALRFAERIDYLILDSTVTVIPAEIGRMKKLKSLTLQGCPVSTLPQELYSLPNLQEITFERTNQLPISEVIEQLQQCASLKNLIILDVDLYELPPAIGNLTGLQELGIVNAKLSALPENIGQLVRLKILTLEGNVIHVFPSSVQNWSALEALNMSNNNLIHLPDNFIKIPAVKDLVLSDNPNLDLRSVCKQLKDYDLNTLALDNCNIQIIPSDISLLHTIEVLFLKHNSIEHLPDELFTLSHLRWLRLGYNKIESLPEKIGQLKNLKYIGLESNAISKLPSSLKQIENLSQLFLQNNRFSEEEKRKIKNSFSTQTFIEI